MRDNVIEKGFRILAINPGSTSTKIGIFENEKCIIETVVRHNREDLDECGTILGQKQLRTKSLMNAVEESGIKFSSLDAVVGRCGIVKPLESGTYAINDELLYDLINGEANVHASALGGIIAQEIGDSIGIPSFVVDPVVVDEMIPIAKVTGIKGVVRRSIFHALNTKAVARRMCNTIDKKYEDSRLIVAHMGGGITVGAHLYGKVIDVNDAKSGDGPFTPERAGSVPLIPIIDMCFSGSYSQKDMHDLIVKGSGMQMHLGTSDLRKVEEMIASGNSQASLILEAMSYQVSKQIGAMFAVLSGRVDGIILTGGLAYSDLFTGYIKERVQQLAPLYLCPGEDELLALVEGALAVLREKQVVKNYQ